MHIDAIELGYLIILTDEIFGRTNRISVITFKQSSVSGPKAANPGLVNTNSFIVYYVKDRNAWKSFRTFVATKRDERYNKFILNYEAPYTEWRLIGLKEAFCNQYKEDWKTLRSTFADKLEEKLEAFVLSNAERVVRTARVSPQDVNKVARKALADSVSNTGLVARSVREDREDYYFLNGEHLIFYSAKSRVLDGRRTTVAPVTNLWDDLLSNNLHKEGSVSFPNGKKPEFLVKRMLELSTEEGDIVLDAFAGSGTTGAVAHKMKRRWIMIEMGEHCYTHIVPRMQRVIDGTDFSGITKAVQWRGGGGFGYYCLTPAIRE